MAKKKESKALKRKEEFLFQGRTVSDLAKLSMEEFAELLPARQHRSVKGGLVWQNKRHLAALKNKTGSTRHLLGTRRSLATGAIVVSLEKSSTSRSNIEHLKNINRRLKTTRRSMEKLEDNVNQRNILVNTLSQTKLK